MPKAEQDTTPSLPPPTSAALQEVRNRKAALDARAAAVRISVQRMKSEREAAGDGLSPDVAGAYVRIIPFNGGHSFWGLSDHDRGAIFRTELDFIVKTTGSGRSTQ